MARDPYFDILFEPVKIGPVTTKNRFYQVPHCTGMGHRMPNTLAGMRGVKAEGGWGVVNTEYCSIHPTSEDIPYPHAAMWDDSDMAANALMAEKVHEHGALAGIQLWHGGDKSANLYSREPTLGAQSGRAVYNDPVQSRIVDKSDLKKLRSWYVKAAKRAKQAEFDLIYVYAAHDYLLHSFLSDNTNFRTDEYGGSPANRVRLLKEIIEEVKSAVGDKCAIAVRYSANDGQSMNDVYSPGTVPLVDDQKEMLEVLAELPDLWDLTVSDYTFEMGTSRFIKEASLEKYVSYVRSVTTKPIVSVGRFTSPNTMVRQVKEGIVDLIGAARPSISDPFIPNKIDEGREEEIRECIGCNVCFASDNRGAPIRCTQNPTMGEEWRKGWHPERINVKKSDDSILIIGAGPSGLEAGISLAKRGYNVAIAEASNEIGGRALKESLLPGLNEWNRITEYRAIQVEKLDNLEVYLQSKLTPADILEMGSPHVVFATGASWRKDGFGLQNWKPLKDVQDKNVFTPDDIMRGNYPSGRVMLFDDDHYYMGSVIAEKLIEVGCTVDYVTTYSNIGAWTKYTAEQGRIISRLMSLNVNIITSKNLKSFDGSKATYECIYTEKEESIEVDALMMVTARTPNDSLYHEMNALTDEMAEAGIKSLARTGDCLAPGTLAQAIYFGHKFAREFQEPEAPDVAFKREQIILES
ncbi:MAG: NAD(P)-binding protein [Flavobacteriales bacterium]|nr:NAD(P)-binding protein [Flavobacteriales bacterium]